MICITEEDIMHVFAGTVKDMYVKKDFNPDEIIDYKVFNDKVVVLYFADGTEEKTVCNAKDKFSIERAAEVGVMKKKLGGSNAYNKLVNNAIKQIEAINKRKAAEKAEEELQAHRRQKDIERKIKRKEKKREEQIEIQKEAYIRAMKECGYNIPNNN